MERALHFSLTCMKSVVLERHPDTQEKQTDGKLGSLLQLHTLLKRASALEGESH